MAAAAVAGVLAMPCAAASRDPAPAPCAPEGGETVTITGVGDSFDLTLADGRIVRLAGIDPVRAPPAAPSLVDEARAKLAAWLVGRSVTLKPLDSAPDRWGRLPGLVFAAPPGTTDALLSVSFAAVDAGYARGRPEPESHACWAAILSAERGARSAMLGLWRDPYYAVRKAEDGSSLVELAGDMVEVEGRVAHVGQTRTWAYVDLGPGRNALALSVARRDLFILDQLGPSQNDWVGRFLRVRGVLNDRNRPQMELYDPDQVEVLDGLTAREGSSP